MHSINYLSISSGLIFTVGCAPIGGATDAQLGEISALRNIWVDQNRDKLKDLDSSGGVATRSPIKWGEQFTKSSDQAVQPNQLFLDGLSREIQTCANAADKYRSAYDMNRKWSIGVATVGIIAGSIAVPALAAGSASASWVAGVGGVAGATNAAQLTLNSQGMSAASSAQAYATLASKIDAHLASLRNVETGIDGTAFILRLRAICLFSPLPEINGSPNEKGAPEK